MSGFNEAKQAFEEYKKVVTDYKNSSSESINNLNNQVNNLQENMYKMFNRHQFTSSFTNDIELKHSEKFFNIKSYKGDYGNQLEIYSKYCKAFNNYIRYSSDKHGEGLHEVEKKSLSIGAASEGGYYLPINMFEGIMERVKEISPIRKIASVIQISGDRLKLPNGNINIPASWINETRAAKTCPQNCTSECISCCNTGPIEKEISLFEHFTNPKVSQIHLDDNQFPVQEWLINKIASSFAASESSSFISGTGTYQPKGFLSYSTEAKGDSDSRAADKLECICCCCETGTDKCVLTAAKMIKTVFALNSTYRNGAVWLMNRKTLGIVRKLKDENDTPIWNFENNSTPTVLGYPVYEVEGMPDLPSEPCTDGSCCASGSSCCTTGTCSGTCKCTTPIVFGNFHAGYQVIDQGIKILRDPYSCKPWVMFYASRRVGGDVVNTNAIKVIKCCKTQS